MNCDFKILWFEDDPEWYEMQSERIAEKINCHCLHEKITRKTDNDFKIEELLSNNYDLILMDYRLAQGANGSDVIKQIRGNKILTDILFYSSQYPELINEMRNSDPLLDGIYHADRKGEDFERKIDGLITKIVRRSEDVINLRGVVLDNSSDFELRISDILRTSWDRFDEKQQDILEQAATRWIKDHIGKRSVRDNKIIESAQKYPLLIDDSHIFSVYDHLYVLIKIIDILKKQYKFPLDAPEFTNFKENYAKDLLRYRNAFGHVKTNATSIRIGNEDIQIDSLHKLMRENIQKYDSLIKQIEEYLSLIEDVPAQPLE